MCAWLPPVYTHPCRRPSWASTPQLPSDPRPGHEPMSHAHPRMLYVAAGVLGPAPTSPLAVSRAPRLHNIVHPCLPIRTGPTSGGHCGSSAVDGCLLPLPRASPGGTGRGRPPSGRPPIVLQRPSASLALLVPCVLPEWPSIQGNAGHTQWPPLGSSAPACPWPRPHAPPPAQPRRPSTRARLLILRQAGTQMLRRRLRPLPGPSAQLPRPGPPPAEGPSLPPVVPWLSASTPWLSSRSGCCNGCVAPGPRASACPAPMALAPRPPCPDRLPKARRDRPCSINQSRAG